MHPLELLDKGNGKLVLKLSQCHLIFGLRIKKMIFELINLCIIKSRIHKVHLAIKKI